VPSNAINNDACYSEESLHSPKIRRSLAIDEDEDNDYSLPVGTNGRREDIDSIPTLCSPPSKKTRPSQSSTDVDTESNLLSANAEIDPASRNASQSITNDLISPDDTFSPDDNCSHASEQNKRENQELRNRLRIERKRKTEEKISEIKRKTKESESRWRIKKKLIKFGYISLGIFFLFGVGYYVYSQVTSDSWVTAESSSSNAFDHLESTNSKLLRKSDL